MCYIHRLHTINTVQERKKYQYRLICGYKQSVYNSSSTAGFFFLSSIFIQAVNSVFQKLQSNGSSTSKCNLKNHRISCFPMPVHQANSFLPHFINKSAKEIPVLKTASLECKYFYGHFISVRSLFGTIGSTLLKKESYHNAIEILSTIVLRRSGSGVAVPIL